MENENTTLRLVKELVSAKDEVSGYVKDYYLMQANYNDARSKLDGLIETILDNCKLDYNGKALTIDDPEEMILTFVKIIAPSDYDAVLSIKSAAAKTKTEKEEGKK